MPNKPRPCDVSIPITYAAFRDRLFEADAIITADDHTAALLHRWKFKPVGGVWRHMLGFGSDQPRLPRVVLNDPSLVIEYTPKSNTYTLRSVHGTTIKLRLLAYVP